MRSNNDECRSRTPCGLAFTPNFPMASPVSLGPLTGRAEAYVMRLSCLYALQDMLPIRFVSQHLRAALALWRYAEQSIEYVIRQDARQIPKPTTIYHALKKQTRRLKPHRYVQPFHRHVKAEAIERALVVLQDAFAIEGHPKRKTGAETR